MTRTLTIEELDVATGAAFLDAVYPEWRERVRGELLNIQNECQCIIGQSLAPFALDYLDLADWLMEAFRGDEVNAWMQDHGFLRRPERSAEALDAAWAALLTQEAA